MKNSQFYDPKRDDRKLFSNLDNNWAWNNEKVTESVSNSKFEELLVFGDKLKKYDASTIMFGIDEIAWDGQKPGHGTYGFEKAESVYSGGENYLSNSIIIFRTYESLQYSVHLCCEKRFRQLEIISTIIDFIGKLKCEKQYFAPENEAERAEWNSVYAEAEIKFNTMKAELENMIHKFPHTFEDRLMIKFDNKVNVRKYIKKYLCTEGWEIKKNLYNEGGTKICKDKGESVISIIIFSLEGGHYLQTLIKYESIRFSFGINTSYSCTLPQEDDVCKYLENIKILRDSVYDML